MNPTTKAAVIEALEKIEQQTTHGPQEYARAALAALRSEPEPTPEPGAVPRVGDIWRDSTGEHEITAVDRGVITTSPVVASARRAIVRAAAAIGEHP